MIFSRVGGGVFIVSADGNLVKIFDEAETEISFASSDTLPELIDSESLNDFLEEFQTGD